MASNKMTNSPKLSGDKNTPEKEATGKVTGTTPLTNRNCRGIPASMSAVAEHGSPSTCYIVDDEDTEDDGNSGDEDVAIEKNLNKLAVSDEAGVEVITTPTGRYNTNIKKQSMSDERGIAAELTTSDYVSAQKYKVKKNYSPGNESFVQNAAGSRSDDPFSSAYKPPQRRLRHSHSAEVTPTSSRLNSRTQGMWRAGGTSPQNSESPTRDTQASITEERAKISGKNAQAHFSPSACIFVANLSSNETETDLEAAVTKMFRRYGTVFVKIRRDPKNMPYAFCQFTDDGDAIHALEDSRGRLIHGRPVRTERARANRMFSFRRITGNSVTVEECRLTLEQYGAIESIWYPSEDQMLVLRLQGAVLMQFAFFDDGRKAQQGVRYEGIFQLDSIANLLQSSPQSSGRRDQTKSQRAQDYLKEYERDRNSIFVGNLPQDFTEPKVRGIFEHYGTILKIIIHQKPSQRNPGQLFSYCFVEYDDPVAPNRAIAAKNNFMLDGHALKVSAKDSEYRNSGFRSYGNPGASASYRSPPALHVVEASRQVYHPYGYGYIHTPPAYGYGGYYTHGTYASPWTYNWGNGYTYAAPPPTYHGPVAQAPTPNPMFNAAYPNQVDYSGQSYSQGPYAYQPYTHQGTAVANAPVQQYQPAADNDNAQADEYDADAQ